MFTNKLFLLIQIRGGSVNESKMYDAEHETRRKQQLERLYSRTPKQVFINI